MHNALVKRRGGGGGGGYCTFDKSIRLQGSLLSVQLIHERSP